MNAPEPDWVLMQFLLVEQERSPLDCDQSPSHQFLGPWFMAMLIIDATYTAFVVCIIFHCSLC